MLVWLTLTGMFIAISLGYIVVSTRRKDSYLMFLALVYMMGGGVTACIYGAVDST